MIEALEKITTPIASTKEALGGLAAEVAGYTYRSTVDEALRFLGICSVVEELKPRLPGHQELLLTHSMFVWANDISKTEADYRSALDGMLNFYMLGLGLDKDGLDHMGYTYFLAGCSVVADNLSPYLPLRVDSSVSMAGVNQGVFTSQALYSPGNPLAG